jgi:hypothetical protein
VASGLNVFAGLYLLLSSLINRVIGGNEANGVVVGFIVVVLAATRLSGKAGPWAGWIDAAIGIWVIFAPWVYGYAAAAWMWNAIVVGCDDDGRHDGAATCVKVAAGLDGWTAGRLDGSTGCPADYREAPHSSSLRLAT